jgi:hypothetical protein
MGPRDGPRCAGTVYGAESRHRATVNDPWRTERSAERVQGRSSLAYFSTRRPA